MASIPCAAYQASHIHGNLRKQSMCRSLNFSSESTSSISPPSSPPQRKGSLTESFLTNVVTPLRKRSWTWGNQNTPPQNSEIPPDGNKITASK